MFFTIVVLTIAAAWADVFKPCRLLNVLLLVGIVCLFAMPALGL
jgi:hypothetical protein